MVCSELAVGANMGAWPEGPTSQGAHDVPRGSLPRWRGHPRGSDKREKLSAELVSDVGLDGKNSYT